MRDQYNYFVAEGISRREIIRLRNIRRELSLKEWEEDFGKTIVSHLVALTSTDEQTQYIAEFTLKEIFNYVIELFNTGEVRNAVIIGILKELVSRNFVNYDVEKINEVQRKFNIQ